MEFKCTFTDQELSESEWHEARLGGIGGSEAATVLGINRYETPFKLHLKKTRQTVDIFKGNKYTEIGKKLEATILNDYVKSCNQAVVVCKASAVSNEYPFMRANFDGFLVEPSDEFPAGEVTYVDNIARTSANVLAYVEVKTAGLETDYITNEIIDRPNYDNSEWLSLRGAPEGYYWQTVHCAAVLGINKTIILARVGGMETPYIYRYFNIPQQDFDYLINAEAEFWKGVEENSMVNPSAVVSLAPDVVEVFNEYKFVKAEIDRLQDDLKSLRKVLEASIGENDEAEFDGKVLFTYKTNKPSMIFDEKSFKEDCPDLWEQYAKEKAGSRSFRIKETN